MCWKKPDEAPPTKFRKSRSAGKVLMSIFWDARGVLLTKFINKGETINADYHAQLLVELREAIKQKRRGMISRGILLLQDNAPAHTAHTSTSAAEACGIELLPHPPYSPDLAPSDFHLFSNLKRDMRGRHFGSDLAVKNWVQNWLSEKQQNFYQSGIQALQDRLHKCIEINGDYVEKR